LQIYVIWNQADIFSVRTAFLYPVYLNGDSLCGKGESGENNISRQNLLKKYEEKRAAKAAL
jgi:hypothetical protein